MNVNAIKAVAGAVQGTIGPKGLDTMLVDQFGDVVITNDGLTILNLMEVNHPAAKMLINIAKAQQEEVGDGTTTATIMAGELVNEGLNQVRQGVPVAKVIEGLRKGSKKTLELIKENSRQIQGLNDPVLHKIALVAGREYEDMPIWLWKQPKWSAKEKLEEPLKWLLINIEEGGSKFSRVIIIERINKQIPSL